MGDPGRSAPVTVQQKTDQQRMLENQQAALGGNDVASLMASYGSGQTSLQDALSQAQTLSGKYGEGSGTAIQQALATNPLAAQQFASQQTQSDPILGKLFGKGGLQEQVQGAPGQLGANLDESRAALSGKGDSYGLTENDLKAYGQASGNIARQFGSQEQSLAQSLADRGFGQAGGAPAAAAFSGLQGNKNEQLAQAQQSIAQNRINSAKELAMARNQADQQRAQMAGNLGLQGAQATSNLRSQNMGGQAQQYGQLQGVNQSNMAGQEMYQNAKNEEFAQKESTRFDPGQALAKAGIGALTSLPGVALKAALGGG